MKGYQKDEQEHMEYVFFKTFPYMYNYVLETHYGGPRALGISLEKGGMDRMILGIDDQDEDEFDIQSIVFSVNEKQTHWRIFTSAGQFIEGPLHLTFLQKNYKI